MAIYRKMKALGTEIVFCFLSYPGSVKEDFQEIRKIVIDFENRFSRFKKNSELNKFNRSSNSFQASALFLEVIKLAKKFFKETGGLFDPTISKTLVSLGYDKSFEKGCNLKAANNNFKIDFNLVNYHSNGLLTKSKEVDVDLGGIAKGFLVDYLVKFLKKKKYGSFLVSAGGDLYVQKGNRAEKDLEIDLENPKNHQKSLGVLKIKTKKLAIATSGVYSRKWQVNGQTVHHLIDPRTKKAVKNEILSVTVLTNSVTKADVLAKTILILGIKQGLDFMAKKADAEVIIVDKNLQIVQSSRGDNYLFDII